MKPGDESSTTSTSPPPAPVVPGADRVEAPARQHGLDALRAGALGLGIVLHSLMPFLPVPAARGSSWTPGAPTRRPGR